MEPICWRRVCLYWFWFQNGSHKSWKKASILNQHCASSRCKQYWISRPNLQPRFPPWRRFQTWFQQLLLCFMCWWICAWNSQVEEKQRSFYLRSTRTSQWQTSEVDIYRGPLVCNLFEWLVDETSHTEWGFWAGNNCFCGTWGRPQWRRDCWSARRVCMRWI